MDDFYIQALASAGNILVSCLATAVLAEPIVTKLMTWRKPPLSIWVSLKPWGNTRPEERKQPPEGKPEGSLHSYATAGFTTTPNGNVAVRSSLLFI